MIRYYLTIRLQSDATFGRGEGVAGFVGVEIDHDQYGFPYLNGRALKGLLREEWHNIRFALGNRSVAFNDAAIYLFGRIGATSAGTAAMQVGSATLPPTLMTKVHQYKLPREEVLAALTAIRRQTAIDAKTGAPEPFSLRAMRVLLRGTPLIAPLDFSLKPEPRARALLAACVLGVRRGGVLRNRGRGRMELLLHEQPPIDYDNDSFTKDCFASFAQEVRK